MKKYKFKIRDKVKDMGEIGTIIFREYRKDIGAIYLVKFNKCIHCWCLEDLLKGIEKNGN